MAIFGFEETTIALLFIFAFFILAVYAIIRLVLKVVFIAFISMAFPLLLSYLGLYKDVSINTIFVFGILGSFLYITYFFVDKLLGLIWPFFTPEKEKPEKHRTHRRKSKKEKEEQEEVEIGEQ